MKSNFRVTLPEKSAYFRLSVEIGLDEDWKNKRKNFPNIAKRKGIYVLHTKNPREILYVGKTRGETMNFSKRLYRHATYAASRNSTVYQALTDFKGEGKRIYAGLIDVEQIKTFFSGERLSNSGYIDIFEQIAIHFLRPKFQRDKEW